MFFKKCDTKLTLTTAYHPQTDGQSERVNQCLEIFLRCSVSTTPAKWSSWLSMDEFWYNSSYHTSLGTTPFKALYGTDPHYVMLPAQGSKSAEATAFMQDRAAYSDWLKQQLA
jgi:hypothetical protein